MVRFLAQIISKKIVVSAVFVSLFSVMAMPLVNVGSASALSGSDFNPGRIIDDEVFYNSSSMTIEQIQQFLDSKVPSCDVWGTKSYTYRYNSSTGRVNYAGDSSRGIPGDPYVTTTRAVYGERIAIQDGSDWRGSKVPYSCINTKRFNTATVAADPGRCDGYTGASNESAATIIYKVAKSCGMNPQAILVLLQKEQSLITETWPWGIQYDKATGAFCPDNPPDSWAPSYCDPEYLGFQKQVYFGAHRFKVYKSRPFNYNYVAGRNNYILWSPNTACGGSNVFIQNQATAALYIYTPYQPNQAALNNLYGTGDGCSAYGNRNFWRMWNDWFGSTYGTVNVTTPLSIKSDIYSTGLYTGKNIRASFTIKNNSGQVQDIGSMAIAVRGPNGENLDFGLVNVVLQPWQSYSYNQSRVFDIEGEYSFYITNYRSNYGWNDFYPESTMGQIRAYDKLVVQNPLVVSEAPSIRDQSLHAGQQTTVNFTVKNTSNRYAGKLGYFGLAVTGPNGNADPAFSTVETVAPGASVTYSKSFTPRVTGDYEGRVSATADGGKTWSEAVYPLPVEPANNRVKTTVKPAYTMTQGVVFDKASPRAGEPVGASFKVKNWSGQSLVVNNSLCLIVRGQDGSNHDYGCLQVGALSANQELTFSRSRSMPAGEYKAYFSTLAGGVWRDNITPALEAATLKTVDSFKVLPSLTLTKGLTIDTSSPRAGDLITGSFSVKNWSSVDVSVDQRLCYIVRHESGSNHDLGCLDLGVVRAGETVSFSGRQAMRQSGEYKAYFSTVDKNNWLDYRHPDTESVDVVTELKINVKSNPTLTQGLTIDKSTIRADESVNGLFKVKNFSNSDITLSKKYCFIIRDERWRNYDLGCLDGGEIKAGQEVVFSARSKSLPAGRYSAYFSSFDGRNWVDGEFPALEKGSESVSLVFTVSP